MSFSTRITKTAGVAALTFAILFASLLAPISSTYASSLFGVGDKAVVSNTGGDNIRVRQGAGTNYAQVAEAHQGDTVTILAGPGKDSDGSSWYKIQAPAGAGWILSDFLAAPGQATSGQVPSKLTGTARVVNTDGDPLRVRSEASRSGSVISEIDPNVVVVVKQGPVIDGERISWYQVSVDSVTGWVMAQYLAQDTPQAPAAPPAPAQPVAKPASQPAAAPAPKLVGFARVANTDGDNLRVRSETNRNSAVLATLAPDTSVVVKQGPVMDNASTAWYQVSADGVTGWVMAQYLVQAQAPAQVVTPAQPAVQNPAPAQPAAPAPPPAPAQPAQPAPAAQTAPAAQPAAQVVASRGSTIVGVALRYVGYRYRFGGTTPAGFDCSGFVYYVLNHAGVPVGRDMYSELASGSRVSSKNLQPGDLVFFSGTYKAGLSHTGIYVGNGRFVHAENESTGVVVSDLWSSYWAAHYTTAVRPTR